MDLQHSAYQFKTVFDVLKDLSTDVNLIFTSEGLELTALDPEKVVGLRLIMSQLQSYNWNYHSDIYFGANMQHLYKMLRGVSSDHLIQMEVNPECINVLKVIIYHPTNGVHSTTSLYSLDIPKEKTNLPSLSLDAAARLPTSTFLRTIKDLAHGSKTVTINAVRDVEDYKKTPLVFASKGSTYVYTTSISLNPVQEDQEGLTWGFFDKPVMVGQYVIKYLEKFSKPSLGKTMEIAWSEDKVLRIQYVGLDFGILQLVMSPILEE